LQLVLQHRPAALAREEPMRVAPMLQRSRDLLVAELAIRLVVEVAQPPTEVRGAEADLELDLAAVANPAFAVDDPYVPPRRRQALERAGALVPAEDGFGRMVGELAAVRPLQRL